MRMVLNLHTNAEVAQTLGLSEATLRRQAAKYASGKLGRQWIWTDKDIENYRLIMRRKTDAEN